MVTKILPTKDKPEIAAFGVVKTAGTPELLLARARDIRRFRKVPQIPEMGLFSTPPSSRTWRASPIPPTTSPPSSGASRELRREARDRGPEIVSKIDWSAAGAEKQAVALFNQAIVDYAGPTSRGAPMPSARSWTRRRPSRAPRSTARSSRTRRTSPST